MEGDWEVDEGDWEVTQEELDISFADVVILVYFVYIGDNHHLHITKP